MIQFWKTKISKILNYAIHEHNSGLGIIYNNILFIQRQIKNGHIKIIGDDDNTKWFNRCLESSIESKEKCKKAVDYIYEETKKLDTHEEIALLCLIIRQEHFSEKGTIFQTFDDTFKMAQAFVEKYPSSEWNGKWGIEKEYEDTIVEFIKEYINDRN